MLEHIRGRSQTISSLVASLDDLSNFVSHARDLTSLSVFNISTTDRDEVPLTPEEMGGGRMSTLTKWRRLSDLRLRPMLHNNALLKLVDWLLEPRSLVDLSHVEILHITAGEDVVNRLLRTIGSSLKQLKLHLPDATPDFNINWEFNTALKFLNLRFLDMSTGLMTSTDLPWFLRFLSSIKASNRLEKITLGFIVYEDTFYEEYRFVWQQVDRILAGAQFEFLQKLDFAIWVSDEDMNIEKDSAVVNRICMSTVSAFPLLVERGVSVEARQMI
ncbi:hypothetical protein JB92DRAFT_3119675 [Gautieria morchelliformis]|nr:hypothetical protein JB92DRAFT_3119675 [Gautieria morchelliformis]